MPMIRPVPMARKMAPISLAEPGAERNADQAESPGHRHAGAHIAVDHHDDHADHRG